MIVFLLTYRQNKEQLGFYWRFGYGRKYEPCDFIGGLVTGANMNNLPGFDKQRSQGEMQGILYSSVYPLVSP